MLSSIQLSALAELRRTLHQYPELSGEETQTAQRIEQFINAHAPADQTLRGLGGAGLAFIYDSGKAGATVLVRAELDGLPISEGNAGLEHRSCCAGKSHLCGHDGHMAIVAAVALRLAQQRPQKGRAVLLFQPAEETGRGMKAVIADPQFAAIKPDIALALHNIPGLPLGVVSCCEGSFSSSVESLILRFAGSTSHAAEPEKAVNPALVVADVLHFLHGLNRGDDASPDFLRASVTYAGVGAPSAHGVTAGDGRIDATLRARTPEKLANARQKLQAYVQGRVDACNAMQSHGVLSLSVDVTEPFDANVNHADAVALIRRAAASAGATYVEQQTPNNWGEDNGAITNLAGVKGAMFGLGSGESQPPLHHPDFDFPDALIETGSAVFMEALREVLHCDSAS